ncbi:MAG: hypothetical protein U9R34_03070 [Nanoarchaeota archaeon]|nr:hypothetical protein [Nanoarchaeota archaeon]
MKINIPKLGHGNLFGISSFISGRTIIFFILALMFLPVVAFIVGEKSPFNLISLNTYIISFVVAFIIFFIKNHKTIIAISVKYLELKSLMTWYLIITIIIATSSFFLIDSIGSKPLLISLFLLWLVSGFLRTYIQKSKALFKLELNKMLLLCKAFAFSRASFYFLLFSTLPSWEIFISYINYDPLWFVFLLLISCFMIKYIILPLYPYFRKSPTIKESLMIIRSISNSAGISFENLRTEVDKSENYMRERLETLTKLNYITKKRRYFILKKEYQKILEH